MKFTPITLVAISVMMATAAPAGPKPAGVKPQDAVLIMPDGTKLTHEELWKAILPAVVPAMMAGAVADNLPGKGAHGSEAEVCHSIFLELLIIVQLTCYNSPLQVPGSRSA